MELHVCARDDGVRNKVMRWIRRSRVLPRVIVAWKNFVELSCLARYEDYGFVAVAEEVLDGELVELRRHRREDRLEFGEPAAERLAAPVPELLRMLASDARVDRDGLDLDLVDEREADRGVVVRPQRASATPRAR